MPLAEGRLERLQILKLLQCVRNEDVEQIEKLITNGVPHLVNYSEPESGETALHLAASQNNEKIISLLLDLGASPNMVDLKGRSPAMRAVELGHVQALILLTEAGTDMTIRDIENKGILFYCLQPTRRHLDCLRLSIDHGASVNNVSKDGQPLIVVAAEAGLEEMTKVLLESGSNPNSKHEKTGFTALQAAAISGSLECARAILEAGADYDVLDNENVHAAHKAASKGYLDIIRLLAAYGADLGKVSLDGNTPMHLAAAKGFGAVCKFLGQRGCPSTFKNKEGKTPKTLAKDNEHKEALKECKKAEKVAARLAKGTGKGPGAPYAVRLYDWLQEHEKRVLNMFHQFDQEDKEGKFKGKVTQENFVVCLQTLNVPVEAEDLQKLALVHDLNKEDNVDYNLFLTGKKFINKQYMVSQGKKKKKKGGKKGRRKKGKTKVPLPICTAPDGPRTKNGGPPPNYVERYVSFTDYTRFNRDHPPTHPIQDDSAWYLNSPETTYISINDAAKMGDLESIKVAIYRGMSVDQRDKFFKTPLMTSCAHGNIEMARALLDFGADVNAKDSFRWTPLHHACHCGQVDLVSLLLDKGAELDAQTFSHGTPLMRAIESSREEVVALLISKGAKVQLQNKKGHTALDIAKAYADPRVVAIVQKRWDEIPPPVNKKKRGGGPGGRQKGGAKSAVSKTHMPKVGTKVKVPVLETKEEVLTSTHSENTNNRTSSVLRAVSALGIANEKPPPLVFVPKRAWVSQPTTEDLLRDREVRRSRFGSDIDFDDYLPAFQKHISQKSLALQKLYA